MGVPTSEVGYTPAMPRREDHEVHKGHVAARGGGWLHKRASMLRYAYFASLVQCVFIIGKSHTWNTKTRLAQLYVTGREDSRMLKLLLAWDCCVNGVGDRGKGTRINRERFLERNALFRT